jgi:hypothetical protein
MEAIIGGAIVGAAVVTLGRPLVSGLGDVLSPVGDEVMKAGNAAYGAVAGTVAGAGAWVSGLVGGDGERGLEKVEEFGKDLVWEMAEEEAATFIKMALVLAL